MREAELDRLRDRIYQLETLLGLKDIKPIVGVFPPQYAEALGLLLKREFVSYEAFEAMGVNGIRVILTHMRRAIGDKDRKLIRTAHGRGAYIEAQDKPKVRVIIERLRRCSLVSCAVSPSCHA